MFLVVSLAWASSVECGVGFQRGATIPTDGTVEVPVDVVLSASFVGGWNCDADDWTFELLDSSGAVVASEFWTAGMVEMRRWITLTPSAPLVSGTEYVARLTSSRYQDVEEWSFTTGSGVVAGFEGLPAVASGSAAFDQSQGVLSLEWAATPVPDPDSMSLLQVQSDDFSMPSAPCDAVAVFSEAEVEGACALATGFAPSETCFRVRQVDGLGRPTEWSADTCVAVVGGCAGCAARPGGLPSVLTVVSVLAAVVRRRE